MRYERSLKCPYCGREGKDFTFLKEWTYTYLNVNRFQCPECKEKFRINWGEKETGEKVEYTIPRPLK
jgi:predicted RNA-binding Zn-ribbon protein involved in translation (DUF1610 family)